MLERHHVATFSAARPGRRDPRDAAPASRRGTAAVALVIVLVVLMLVTTGMILAGARDQDLTAFRLDTVRAFYAAEAGANMAIREVMRGVDEDGDGGVGSVSNDGNSANDPALGTARVSVSVSTADGDTTVFSAGRDASCRRWAEAVLRGAHPMCVMARGGSTTPRYSIWNAGAWGANTAMPWSLGGRPQSVVGRPCPARNELLYACIDDQHDVGVAVWNGSSWSSPVTVSLDASHPDGRPFDAAYEGLSGDGLVAYWDNTSAEIRFNTWNGTAWSSGAAIAGSGATDVRFLSLISGRTADEIICLFTSATSLKAAVWNGSSWGAWTTLSTAVNGATTECFGGARESQSGHAVVVYGEASQAQPRCRTWNGSAWSAASMLPTMGKSPIWLRLAPDPTTDRVVFVATNTDENIYGNAWDGSAWAASNSLFVTGTGGHAQRRFDAAFEPGTGHALAVYRNGNKNKPVYRTWSASVWSAEQDGPNLNRKLSYVYLAPGSADGELFLCTSDDTRDLHLLRWSGSALSTDTELEDDLSTGVEPVSIIGAPASASTPVIIRWSEAQP